MTNKLDKEFMGLAIKEARKTYENGDVPIGAVLVINDKLIGAANNQNKTNKDWNSHAETSLIKNHSQLIRKSKKENAVIEIYTTLEPCLMCLGTAFFNRVERIIYACPDPNGGTAKLDVSAIPKAYSKKWPRIEQEISFAKESYDMLVKYMKENNNWRGVLESFRGLTEFTNTIN